MKNFIRQNWQFCVVVALVAAAWAHLDSRITDVTSEQNVQSEMLIRMHKHNIEAHREQVLPCPRTR